MQQKRDAAKRQRMMAVAPEHVREKWAAICALKGRDHAKNVAKQKFCQVLFADEEFTDAYWQESIVDKYVKSQSNKKKWVLRARANALHGVGEAGEHAVQVAIDTGIYPSRIHKKRDKHGVWQTIEEVAMTEGNEVDTHSAELIHKHRAGCASSSADFKNDAMARMTTDEIQKKPTAFDGEDSKNKETGASGSKDIPAIMDREAGKMSKRPADSPNKKVAKVMKRPAAAGSDEGLTLNEDTLAAHNDEAEKQNETINGCLNAALKVLNQKHMALMGAARKLTDTVLSGIQAKLKEQVNEEIKKVMDNAINVIPEIQNAYINKKDAKYTDEKVDILQNAGSVTAEADDVLATACSLTNKTEKGSSGSAPK